MSEGRKRTWRQRLRHSLRLKLVLVFLLLASTLGWFAWKMKQAERKIVETPVKVAPPPVQPLERADLSPQARGFYAENRRVANGKAKRVLGWAPRYPTYREGLASLR